ncbi:MAG TPA: FAD-dependent oxidoreductase [Candidatus Limnocylindrales bacterium]|nr:FAD-dependent oxidoreductase [Candidatus Limnocylindrales bacterium]
MLHPVFLEHELRLIGHRWSPRVHELKRFLARSRVPFRWLDLDSDPDARGLAAAVAPRSDQFPIVLFPDGTLLIDPDVQTLAERLGLPTEPSSVVYDLVIVGAGPAGLSASISGASEGLHTVVVDQDVPGGQISYSAMIENYPGFPQALDGSSLAHRMVAQAERFGVEIVVLRRATALRADGLQRKVTLEDGTELTAHSVVLSLGVSFAFLDAPGCASLVGAGIYYGAATVEAAVCRNQDVYILGGGNSAGQAALFLARFARSVHIVTRDDSLAESMSRYLIERIEDTPNIVVHPHATVAAAGGHEHLEWIELQDTTSGDTTRVPTYALFVFIGASPRSEWLEGTVERDDRGFVLAGVDYLGALPEGWPLERRPYLLETRIPGVFAAGDVRRTSVKRMTAAAGEGATVVQFVHQYLRETLGRTSGRHGDGGVARASEPSGVQEPVRSAPR